jgi:hypothetical protein
VDCDREAAVPAVPVLSPQSEGRVRILGDHNAAARKPSLLVRIDQDRAHPLVWKLVVKHAVFVVMAGIAIYLVFPAITEVLASWPELSTLDPRWFAVTIAAEVGHFCCTFTLQRLALRTRVWFPVITAQLAGNAITLITPAARRRVPRYRSACSA